MTIDQAIKYYGTQANLARALGLSKGSISKFRKSGTLPREHQLDIERWTGGALTAEPKNPGFIPRQEAG